MTGDNPTEVREEGDEEGLVAYGPSPELREAMRQAVEQALRTAGPDFGEAMRSIQAALAGADPLVLTGALAMYGGTAEAGTNPEFSPRLDIFGFHIELVQALAFRARAGTAVDVAEVPFSVVEDVARAVRRLTDAWIVLEARKIDQAVEGEPRDLAKVLVRLRVNATAVRGWAYQDRMVAMLEELFAPLDAEVDTALGWRPSALPSWWMALGDALNARLEAHRAAVREAADWPADEHWLPRLRERFGALPVDDEAALLVAAGADEELRRGFVYHSSDLRAHEIFKYTLDELVELMPGGVAPETARTIMAAWSILPGEDHGVAPGQLFLENPVVARPFLASAPDQWHLFCPWLLLHNPFELFEHLLASEGQLFTAYLDRRAEFLEERTGRLLRKAFPAAHVETSLLRVDSTDGREYETDAVALLDSFAVVAEAKAGRLGPEARRGRRRQLRDRVDALLVKPSEQAERFADFLIGAAGQPTLRRRIDGSSVTIDAGSVRQALTVGVTLEPMAALLPRLAEVAEAGLSDRTADALSYSISLPDLELIVDLLDHPSEVLHYLGRRAEIERHAFLYGDEVDLLGLYLETGFNLGEKEFEGAVTLNVTGMSDPIDLWHYRQEAGLDAERPRVARTPWWESVLTRVEERGLPRWPEIGVMLCNVAEPDQRKLEGAMQELRRDIVNGRRPATDLLVFHNGPPQRRDVYVGVIATSPDRAQRAEQYENAARAVVGEHDLQRVLLLAWAPAPIEAPYLALVYVER